MDSTNKLSAEVFGIYAAANKLVAQIGMIGAVDSSDPAVEDCMAALHALDGGNVARRVEDLTEKAFMPHNQASRLAVDEYIAIASAISPQLVASECRPTLAEFGALRQFKHNDGSDGFVAAYDKEATDLYISSFAAPQVVADERALFSDWLVTIPLPVQENIKASMARGESYTYKAFCAAIELAANHPCSPKIEGATFICDGAANPVSYSGPNGKMAIDLRGWTCYAPGAAPVKAQEPVAHLKFWAAQSWSGNGNHDIDCGEGLEVCEAGEIGADMLPAFPVYRAPVQPVAVPDGWKLVPIEPTEAMVLVPGALRTDGKVARIHRDVWKRMLEAVPSAPAAQGDALSDLLDNMLSIEVGPFDVSIVAMATEAERDEDMRGEALATEPWHKNGPSLKKATVKAIERAIAAKAAS